MITIADSVHCSAAFNIVLTMKNIAYYSQNNSPNPSSTEEHTIKKKCLKYFIFMTDILQFPFSLTQQ